MKVWMYQKIHKAEKGETNVWSSFFNKYEEDGILEALALVDFKKHLCSYWTTKGSPGNQSEKQQKALSITCYNCGKEGHKANECRGENKYKESGGRTGGRGGGRFGRGRGREGRGNFKKRDKSEVMCFKCRDKGHYAYECPKKKENVNEAAKEVETEIALTVCKMSSENEEDLTCQICVDCNKQEYSDHVQCTEELVRQCEIEVQRIC